MIQKHLFQLYVTGMTPGSMSSVLAVKSLCEELLPGRFELKVVNVLEHPELAIEKRILAAPTLIRESPLPERRIVGDLTTRDRFLEVLK